MSHEFSRRKLLLAGGVAGISAAGAAHAGKPVLTPRQTEGPFYPVEDQADKDADLTRLDGQDGVAAGEIVSVSGRVLDANGEPIDGALVDVWQANAAGRYAHGRDPNPAPLDPNFQGWAMLTTGEDGSYRFKTVRPGAYPVSSSWSRPPHIHFKVSKRGYHEVTTQMYFDGDPLNEVDHILKSLSAEEQEAVVAKQLKADGDFFFDVVLAAV